MWYNDKLKRISSEQAGTTARDHANMQQKSDPQRFREQPAAAELQRALLMVMNGYRLFGYLAMPVLGIGLAP